MEINTVENNRELVTINFYSYKGGVGRTTTMAQFARLLAALGKKVAVVDFDLDAPGVPAAFGIKPDGVRGGFLELVYKYFTGNRNAEHTETLLKEYMLGVPEEELINASGGIRLLPSGKPDDRYWQSLVSPFWTEVFIEPNDGTKSLVLQFVDDFLKPALEQMNFDYLLIDSRSGVTNYGRLGWRIANRQMVICCPNDESKEMIAGPLVTLFNADRLDPASLFFIISRMPPELSAESDESIEAMKATIHKIFNNNNIFPVHSDLETLIKPDIRKFDGRYRHSKTEIVQLHADILKIFIKLFADDPGMVPPVPDKSGYSEDAKENKQVNDIWKRLFDKDFGITNKKRLFEFMTFTGEMLNPDDSQRNIAFKVETFIQFLNRFYDAMQSLYAELPASSGDKKDPMKPMNQALFSAGNQCGNSFGIAITNGPEFDATDGSFWKKVANIQEWCRFDTEAGFGQMTCNLDDADEDEREINMKVENLFIINAPITDFRDYTSFFTGYVAGVLSRILTPFSIDFIKIRKIRKSGSQLIPVGPTLVGYSKKDDDSDIFEQRYFSRSEYDDNGISYKIKLKKE